MTETMTPHVTASKPNVAASQQRYYVPEPSPYPVLVSFAALLLFMGAGLLVNGVGVGGWFMGAAALLLLYALNRWFAALIAEDRGGLFHGWEAESIRLGMMWWIGSEVVLLAVFFGVLFYEHFISVPWLASLPPHFTPWPGYAGIWPSTGPAGHPFTPIGPIGLPLIKDFLLFISGATYAWAQWGLKENLRQQLIAGLVVTILLAAAFLSLTGYEFVHAYSEHLTPGSGVYGATFFGLTGLHAVHVAVGLVLVAAILERSLRGDFSATHHFAVQAVGWFWYLVVFAAIPFFMVYWS